MVYAVDNELEARYLQDMTQEPMKLTDVLPKDSELNKLLAKCDITHQLHLHELHDGALSLVCFNCPFHHVASDEEEKILRVQMEQQGIKT